MENRKYNEYDEPILTPRAKSSGSTDMIDESEKLNTIPSSGSFTKFWEEKSPAKCDHYNAEHCANNESQSRPRKVYERFEFAQVSYKLLKEQLNKTPENNLNSRTSIKDSHKIKTVKINLTRFTAKRFCKKISWFGTDVWWRTHTCAILLWDGRIKTSCRNDLASIWVASFLRAYDKLQLFDDELCERKLQDIFYLVGVEPSLTNRLELKHEFLERNLLTAKEERAALRYLETLFE
jgi:hypothetical protein